MFRKSIIIALCAAGLMLTGGCNTSHQVEVKPIETVHKVEPIHITIDVNIRVDRALDDIFEDIEAAEDGSTQ